MDVIHRLKNKSLGLPLLDSLAWNLKHTFLFSFLIILAGTFGNTSNRSGENVHSCSRSSGIFLQLFLIPYNVVLLYVAFFLKSFISSLPSPAY